MSGVDWQATGGLVAMLTAFGTGAWAFWERAQKNRASTNAEVSQSNAEEALYRMLNDRMNQMQQEIKELRTEVGEYRQRNNRLEIHIFKLERLMRGAGLEPPVFEG